MIIIGKAIVPKGSKEAKDGKTVFNFYEDRPDQSNILKDKNYNLNANAKKLSVKTITYDKLLKVCNNYNTGIGIISIDIEGIDTLILKDVLNYKHLPYFIIIESNFKKDRKAQIDLLKDKYHLINILDINMVWIRDDIMNWTK